MTREQVEIILAVGAAFVAAVGLGVGLAMWLFHRLERKYVRQPVPREHVYPQPEQRTWGKLPPDDKAKKFDITGY